MEGSDGGLNRVARAVWTVWGYLTGAVGRYLRPEVRNEEAQNVHHTQEVTLPISESYMELKVKKEEKESPEIKTSERKTREDLQYSEFSVRAAAVQWEKGNTAQESQEVKLKSKHTYTSSELTTHVNQFTEKDEPPAYSDADENNQDRTFSGSKEAKLNAQSKVTNQEWTRKPQGKEKITRIRNAGSEEEFLKSEFIEEDLLAKEADLNVRRSKSSEKQIKEEDEQECVDQTFLKEFKETKEEEIQCSFSEQDLLDKEVALNVKRDEKRQSKIKEEGEKEDVDETLGKMCNETEKKSIKSEFIDQKLLGKEVGLKVEISANSQEQRRKQTEEEKGVDQIVKRESDETGHEPIKCELIDLGSLTKKDCLNAEKRKNKQEQRIKQEEKGVDVTIKRDNDKSKEEPFASESIDRDLLTKKVDLNVECRENNEEQRKNMEKEDVEIMRGENKETKEDLIEQRLLAKEAALHVEDKNSQEQKGKSQKEEKEFDETLTRDHDKTEKGLIKSEFTDQYLLAKEGVERSESSQEQRGKEEMESVEIKREKDKAGEELTEDANLHVGRTKQEPAKKTDEENFFLIMTRNIDETEKEPVLSEFTDQTLLTKKGDLNISRSKNKQDQKNKQEKEEEDIIVQIKRENEKSEKEALATKSINQVNLNVKWTENTQEQIRKVEHEYVEIREPEKKLMKRLLTKEDTKKTGEEEDCIAEITKKEKDDAGEEPVNNNLSNQGLLIKKTDLNFESDKNSPEHKRKHKQKDKCIKIIKRENKDFEEEPIKSEFNDQYLLAKEATLNAEKSETTQEQTTKADDREEVVKIMRIKNCDMFKSEFIDHELLTMETSLNRERSESHQKQIRKPEEKIIKEDDTTGGKLLKSEFSNLDLLKKEDNQDHKIKEEEDRVDEIMRRENDKSENQELLAMNTDLNVERTKNSQEQIQKKEEKEKGVNEIMGRESDEAEEEPVKGQYIDQDLDPENQTCLCDLTVFHMASVEKIMECVDNHDINELNVVEQSNYATTEHENKESKSQTVDTTLLIQLASTWEGRDSLNQSPLNQGIQPLVELPESATLQNITPEVALSEDFWQLVDTAHNGSQRPSIMTKHDFEDVVSRPETGTGNQTEAVETTSQFRAEVAAVNMKKSAKRDNSLHEKSVDAEDVTVQEITGQCFLQQESLQKQSADTRINELTSHEPPFSEIMSLSLKQEQESAVVSLDTVQRSLLQKLDESYSKAAVEVEAKISSSEQTAKVFEMPGEVSEMSKHPQPKCDLSFVEKVSDKLIVDESSLKDQINQNKFTVQYSEAEASSFSKALYSLEIESEQNILDLQTDSQKDTEEQERTVLADPGLLDQIKDFTSHFGVEEQVTWISGLAKDLEDIDWKLLGEREAPKRKENTNELERHEETTETNIDVKLQNTAWEQEKELVAEMTDVETIVALTGWEIEGDVHPEKKENMCCLGSFESEESKKINKEQEEKVGHVESVTDNKGDIEHRGRSRLKIQFENISEDNDKDKPSVFTDLLLPSQVSSLDFTVEKSKIAVKNPLVRPPKDPRKLINMASVEPLTPHPSQHSFLKKSHIEGASVPGKGLIGLKLPGLDSGFPALRKTEAVRKMRDMEDSVIGTAQKSDSDLQSADDVKPETLTPKPKWTPPRQPGMGSPLMMAELKSKLKKPAEK